MSFLYSDFPFAMQNGFSRSSFLIFQSWSLEGNLYLPKSFGPKIIIGNRLTVNIMFPVLWGLGTKHGLCCEDESLSVSIFQSCSMHAILLSYLKNWSLCLNLIKDVSITTCEILDIMFTNVLSDIWIILLNFIDLQASYKFLRINPRSWCKTY